VLETFWNVFRVIALETEHKQLITMRSHLSVVAADDCVMSFTVMKVEKTLEVMCS